MVDTAILGLSILIQLVAAGLALWLIRLTKWRLAWLLIAAALTLMAARRAITFFGVLAGEPQLAHFPAETVALAISVLMLAGVALIGPTFRAMRADRRALADSRAWIGSVLDHLEDGIVTIDERGIVETYNPAAERIFGYRADEVIGRNVSMLMTEPDRSRHDGYIRRYLESGEGRIIGVGPRELVARRKDGREVPIDLSVAEMRDGGRRVFIGSVRDISERKAHQEQLQQARKMEAIGQLTGGIAHDFNNLLTAILGNLELAREHVESDPKPRQMMDIAIRAALRGADLTHRLLAFSRRQALDPAATAINAKIPEIAELIRRTIGEHIEIETVLGGGLWPAMVDPNQLENAVLNLAINARDAMPEGGRLTIETANARLDRRYADAHEEVTPGQYVLVAVSDTGTGMSPEVAARAFDPFFTTKEAGKGTGLGLSMVYGFVKQSGGHVKIYSEEGEGTTVRIYLPRAKADEADAAAEQARPPALAGGRETILVVEDDPDVRAFIVAALAMAGYTLLEAKDGPEAIARMDEAAKIDLLLTDVVLPGGMNGREVAEAAEARFPGIKVLFSSGYTENAVVHHGRVDQDVELLAKPYTRASLLRRVRERLDDGDDGA